jgi:hypothetical protein
MDSSELIIVKRKTTKQQLLSAMMTVSVLVIILVAGYWVGNWDGLNLRNENSKLSDVINQMNEQLDNANVQLVKQMQISKVDQVANLHAGSSIDSQHQQIRELERELKLYRSIMAPAETVKGLQISHFNWQQQADNNYSWQLSLSQAGSQGRALSGFVSVSLVAMRGNEEVIVPIIKDEQNKRFGYRFKYFQHLTGNILVSEDLTPLSIKVVAQSTVKGQQSIEKEFPWQSDEEKIANVE